VRRNSYKKKYFDFIYLTRIVTIFLFLSIMTEPVIVVMISDEK
jgi:hypothetical protein